MNDNQLLRYSRHILLDEIGIGGQQRLLDSHVLVIGAGGLGSAALPYLASAGVGHLTIVDHDKVDLTNLQRQIVHTQDTVGHPKVESARQALLRLNPGINIKTFEQRADEVLLNALVSGASVVLDCSDNFKTRHAVNRACVHHRIPLVAGAAIRFDGQLTVFDSRREDSPCYACLFPESTGFDETRCATMGVFAPLVGMIGTMQAAEALKLLTSAGQPLVGKLLLLDARTLDIQTIQLGRQENCAVCRQTASA